MKNALVRVTQAAWVAVVVLALGWSWVPAQTQAQKSFATPEEAVKALVAAAKASNREELRAIFGPEVDDLLSSGDPVADKRQREVVLVAFAQGWRVEDGQDGEKEVIVGNEDWPFPIPLVKEGDGWRFDTEAGADEILARRVGVNELTVIQICRTYTDAQQVYASVGHDGKPEGIFAQKVRSEDGKQDGLYWAAKPGEKLSPLGDMFAQAAEEGYVVDQKSGLIPFHGYFFRTLTAQGPDAPGGAKSYIANGDMTGGFALVARPAEYGNSGIMTFIVNQDGIVYQKDLGEDTAAIADQMKEYNPDPSWKPAQ
ncbi:MAG: DUF2950 domain-containing protein [Candidatus Acidiferrales bacterium]